MSIHSVWLGNNITPLREEEWGEDEEDEADTPAPTSPPLSPINSRSVKLIHFLSQIQALKQVTKTVHLTIRKHRAGVDIHSCSQFLLELYSQWLIPGSPSNRRTPTILISEVVRSVSCDEHAHDITCCFLDALIHLTLPLAVAFCSCWQCRTCSQRGTSLTWCSPP